jgi:hypothetical protein
VNYSNIATLLVVALFVLVLVEACKQTTSTALRLFYGYVFVCVIIWVCIVETEANVTNVCLVRQIGANFRPGYQKLANRHSIETFGIKSKCANTKATK